MNKCDTCIHNKSYKAETRNLICDNFVDIGFKKPDKEEKLLTSEEIEAFINQEYIAPKKKRVRLSKEVKEVLKEVEEELKNG